MKEIYLAIEARITTFFRSKFFIALCFLIIGTLLGAGFASAHIYKKHAGAEFLKQMREIVKIQCELELRSLTAISED